MTRGGKSSSVVTSRKKKKEYSREMDNKRKKANRDNLDDNQIKQLRIYEKR